MSRAVAVNAGKTTPLSSDAEQALLAMGEARELTLGLVSGISDADLERVQSPIMSPLVWDLGHIAAYEDLWLAHRHGGLELLRPDLAELYDAFETPRAIRGEIEALGPAGARDYLAAVRERTSELIAERGSGDGVICEMVVRHELQHSETMRQTMAIAGLLDLADRSSAQQPLDADARGGWATVPAGVFAMGAGAEGFAYDNERPRHTVELTAFEIARRPVTNGSWMHFSEGGGYERRDWWSDEGWAWKEEHDITHHPAVAAGCADAPACHISWFEADAFARAHDARLPTEAEWERAATWSREAAGRDGGGATLTGVGRVWEWTRSHFRGYPGFAAHPYREYSEVFFGDGYRVLRGGSWATHPRVAGLTFRNWDLPQRRQIFAGVRLARAA
ncbi:MAG: gamma-glutamyl hercynylcysteine S-oxide synthase [Solirubrobacteraceae bacterium]|nr:gamma-glutamyl hercynylcysteine S-oxide synthase [Solirubrobacteraceae bacterium]